ncbi:hypothetical protein BDY17DRAFT_141707 [Neohortaea acidophila]|uniref:Uncharacterized protein n=1 Tax=Neohortaea acidophila TaxID=245834 RepID=A0A6A6PT17_9PEZI|nr:uncharacterized protein BDY17DRAFT_141707 [Neohortaea acidophila]KAF2483122.1 hypothetical protein BDY17DRAFT_141707 [Neohortaea acidophila]
MMRKAGFWRWASRKAYNRLVENGRIWSAKGSEAGSKGSRTESAGEGDEGLTEGDEGLTEGDTDVTTPDDEEAVDAELGALSLDLTTAVKIVDVEDAAATASMAEDDDAAAAAAAADDGGWKTVGPPSGKIPTGRFYRKAPPVGKLQLVHNGGLEQFASPVKPARRLPRGFAVSWD